MCRQKEGAGDIQRNHWQVAVEQTVLASVLAFHFLYRVRFGGLSEARRPDLDPEHSDNTNDDELGIEGTKRKSFQRKDGATLNYTDSDSSPSRRKQTSLSVKSLDHQAESIEPYLRVRRSLRGFPQLSALTSNVTIAWRTLSHNFLKACARRDMQEAGLQGGQGEGSH